MNHAKPDKGILLKRALSGSDDLWLDRSAMAIEAAAFGGGVILESEILAERELKEGKLVSLFDELKCEMKVASYFLVRSRKLSRDVPYSTFERWIRGALQDFQREPARAALAGSR